MINNLLRKVVGSKNDREVKRMQKKCAEHQCIGRDPGGPKRCRASSKKLQNYVSV